MISGAILSLSVIAFLLIAAAHAFFTNEDQDQ